MIHKLFLNELATGFLQLIHHQIRIMYQNTYTYVSHIHTAGNCTGRQLGDFEINGTQEICRIIRFYYQSEACAIPFTISIKCGT